MGPTDESPSRATGADADSGTPASINALVGAFAAMAEDIDLNMVLKRVTSAACELVDARYGALGVIGPDRLLSDFIAVGLDSGELPESTPLPRGHGVLGLLVEDPRPLRLHDLRRHERAVGLPFLHPRMKSFLGVPIRIRDRVFGNLYLTEKHGGGDFTETDEKLLVALAVAAAVAIANAQLFDESTRRTRWLESGLDAVGEILEQTNPARSATESIAHYALHASHSDLALVLREVGDRQGLLCEVADGADAASFAGASWDYPALLDELTAIEPPLLLTQADIDRLLPRPAPPAPSAEPSAEPSVEPGSDPGLAPAPALSADPSTGPSGVSTALCVRLGGSGERQYIFLGRRAEFPFVDVDHEMVRIFASHVSLAVELRRAHWQWEQDAVFGDRDRIARDLHDLVIQRLFAAGLSIQNLRKYVSDRTALERIGLVSAELDATIRELRDTIYSLRTDTQVTPTFSAGIFALVAATAQDHVLQPVLHLSGPLDAAVDPTAAEHVRGVLKEGLSNALHHAAAQSITITLRALPDRLELGITDNGTGFVEPSSAPGLARMRRHAELCAGTLSIASTTGHGTHILLTVPLRNRRS